MSFYKEVPGRQTTLESALKFDTEPKAGSTNPVTSDGVKNAIDGAVGYAAAALQDQIDDIAEKAGSGYIPKGEATVATLNGLSGQENGELYTMTDAGTLTEGSLAVVAGDTVAWDATNEVWYKAMDYAPSQYGTNEVHNLSTTITAFRTGDVIPVDGPSGTAKMSKDDLLRVTDEPVFFPSEGRDTGYSASWSYSASLMSKPVEDIIRGILVQYAGKKICFKLHGSNIFSLRIRTTDSDGVTLQTEDVNFDGSLTSFVVDENVADARWLIYADTDTQSNVVISSIKVIPSTYSDITELKAENVEQSLEIDSLKENVDDFILTWVGGTSTNKRFWRVSNDGTKLQVSNVSGIVGAAYFEYTEKNVSSYIGRSLRINVHTLSGGTAVCGFVDASYNIVGNVFKPDGEVVVEVPAGASNVCVSNIVKIAEEDDEYVPHVGFSAVSASLINNIKGGQIEIVVASSNAPEYQKKCAKYFCTGTNDEKIIQQAIDEVATLGGGCVRLSIGDFYIDSFENTDDLESLTAIVIPNNDRVNIRIEGSSVSWIQEPRPSIGKNGTFVKIRQSTYDALDPNQQYKILRAKYVDKTISSKLLMEVRNFSLIIPDNQKKIMGLDFKYTNCVICEKMWLYAYSNDNTIDGVPKVAVDGCVGLRSMGGSNGGTMADFKNICSVGFHQGFMLAGEHVVGINLSAIFCVYGYTFGNFDWTSASVHPMTFINCCSERCVNYPLFVKNGIKDSPYADPSGRQAIDFISFNIEKNADKTPGGVLGDRAVEEYPGAFYGSIDYTIQMPGASDKSNRVEEYFWADGCGKNVRSRNEAQKQSCSSLERMTYAPTFLQRVYDTTLNKEVICIDEVNKTWVDALGNIV